MHPALKSMENPYLYYGSLGKNEQQYNVPNFIGLALKTSHDREISHNALDRLPFEQGTIKKIQSQDVFEHLPKKNIVDIFDDIYRVLSIEGIFRLSLPDYRSSLLRKRSVYDSNGRVLADLMMGGKVFYDQKTASTKVGFSTEGNAHVWFPVYEDIVEMVMHSQLRFCKQIKFYHYYIDDEHFVCESFPENEMCVMRSPPRDNRAAGKPISIVVDFVK